MPTLLCMAVYVGRVNFGCAARTHGDAVRAQRHGRIPHGRIPWLRCRWLYFKPSEND